MNNLLRISFWGTPLVVSALLFSGCSGGRSSSPSASVFAGDYNGNFLGRTLQGDFVNGSVDGIVSRDGRFEGTISQPGLGSFPATGTVDSAGNVNATATGNGFTSDFTGKVTRTNGVNAIEGTFSTNQGGISNAVEGVFTGISEQNTDNPFEGAYEGDFLFSSGNNGTLEGEIDDDGLVQVEITQPGVGTFDGIGVILPNGSLRARALGSNFVTTLTGNGNASASPKQITGSFTTKQGDNTIGTGTFTATRTGNLIR